jgi:2-dehydropantoate 2-reductase
MRIIICGTGAMACRFGASLSAVADVMLLGTWSEGIAAIRDRGILVQTESEVKAFRVKVDHLHTSVKPADLVLVLVKAWQTRSVALRLPSLLSESSVAVTLQNGLGNSEMLGARACLGVTTQGATLLGPGSVRPGGDGPTYMAGPQSTIEILQSAGLEAYSCDAEKIKGLLWGKLAANCAINPLTALLCVANGQLLDNADALGILDAAARECSAVAVAKGIPLPFPDAAIFARDVARRTAVSKSSMLQDLLRGAPTEIDAINGAIFSEGTRVGIPTPVNELLWHLIRASQAVASPAHEQKA